MTITIAIPSESAAGMTGARSEHFGHCPVFTLVDIDSGEVGSVRTVDNIAHEAGGCMKPVAMLAEKGVNAMLSAGMGNGPFQKMKQLGITVYFADLQKYPDVQSVVNGFVAGALLPFDNGQLCTGSGNCHH